MLYALVHEDVAKSTCFLFLVFGVDLTIIVKLYNTKTPVVLKHCISEVERRGKFFVYT